MVFSINSHKFLSADDITKLAGTAEAAAAGGWDPQTKAVLSAISGFGLGASSIALFARVGGGIFTKLGRRCRSCGELKQVSLK